MYIKGQKNVEADTLRRLPITAPDMESILNHPPLDPHNPLLDKNPLDLTHIQQYRNKDLALLKALIEDPHFSKSIISTTELIHYQQDETNEKRIVIPQDLQYSVIRWLHSILSHAGISRLYNTLRTHFWFP